MKKAFIVVIFFPLLSLYGLFLVINQANSSVQDDTDLIANAKSEGKLIVLSSFTLLADMVSEIGGDKVESISLTKSGMNIHDYEPTPQDLTKSQKIDLFVENGLNLEARLGKLTSSVPDVSVVIASDGVEVVSISEGSYENKPNPHAWMSPKQGLVYIENIRKSLVRISPENADYFNARAFIYSEKLKEIDKNLSLALAKIPQENRLLVTCEGAFSYLAKDYNLSETYIWAVNDESDGSPKRVVQIIDELREKKVPTVFCESTFEPLIQREIAKASGAKMGKILYVDSLSGKDGVAPTYLKLVEYTALALAEGLSGK